MGIETVDIDFTDNGVKKIASLATTINRDVENIGARRLHTMMEKLLEEISFNAPDAPRTTLMVDEAYVQKHLGELTEHTDLSKFIL